MDTIVDKVHSGEILVSDGAWGTMLYKKGLKPGDCPELWCIERASDIEALVNSYIESGADMVQTNSFGGSRFKLELFGLGERVAEINEAAAKISRRAAGNDRNIIASIGPTGKMLLMGEITEKELYDAFCEQAEALEKGGADTICIETMSDKDEAAIAVRAAKENTKCEVICTFTFEKNLKGEYRTMMGVSPEDAAKAALDAGADIIGTNCGNGIERMIDIVEVLRDRYSEIPIIVHANAGMPENVDGVDVYPETPEEMASFVNALINAGANIIGGCCGTTPEHIKALRKAVDGYIK